MSDDTNSPAAAPASPAATPEPPTPESAKEAELRSVVEGLDLARGEVNDEDLDALEEAIATLDFATRRAAPARLERLSALGARLSDITAQIREGVRRPAKEQEPLSAEQQARYKQLVDQGVEAGEAGRLDEAVARLAEAVRLDPDGIDALFNLGVVYGLLAHKNIARAEFYDDHVRDEVFVEKAQVCYDAVLDRAPDHLPSLNNLATLASMRNDREAAIEYLRRIVARAPADDDERQVVSEAQAQLQDLGA